MHRADASVVAITYEVYKPNSPLRCINSLDIQRHIFEHEAACRSRINLFQHPCRESSHRSGVVLKIGFEQVSSRVNRLAFPELVERDSRPNRLSIRCVFGPNAGINSISVRADVVAICS